MQKKLSLRFPKDFLWGVSTSAHQVEGGQHNQWTVWELENARSLAAQSPHQYGDLDSWDSVAKQAKQAENYVSGRAVDHYNRYEDDFDLLEKLGMNAYRFSVEWSRVEPKEGAWSVEAIEHYKRYLKELKSRGIEPVMTLFHFTLPVWFAEKGGFTKRSNVRYFVRFAEKIMQEIGRDVRWIITVNEPEVYAYESYVLGNWPPNVRSKRAAFTVLSNLARAHNQTARMVHELGKNYKVSIAKNSPYVYAGDDALLSRRYADMMQFARDDYFLKKVVKHCDFLGVNYYFSDRVYGYRVHNPDERVSDLGWDLSPADLEQVLERLHEKYNLPILITENGLADHSDEHRQWWITQTLIAMQKAMEKGVDLKGYMHWSLLDNFEWDKGFWPRFGLVEVNTETLERTMRPSTKWFARVIKHLRDTSR